MDQALLDDLLDWLRIPSISTGTPDRDGLRRAAEWAADRVRGAGGSVDLVTVDGGNPLVVGDLAAADPGAPTVLVYGHYDVQSPDPLDRWTTPPFAPDIRDGRIYARGACDDKGNFLPLLHVACGMAREGTLPVNVRVLIEGEEEAGSASVARWLADDVRPTDAAIVFDAGMVDPQTPAITVGLRGMVACEIELRVARRDVHSGLYGGSVRNALHVLHAMLATIVPDATGRAREELRAGVLPPSDAERASWDRLPAGDAVLADVGATPVHPGAGAEYYLRNGADASVEIDWVEGGAPRTVVPATARAFVSVRLAPGQDSRTIQATLERLLREAAPDDVELTMSWHRGEPALFPPEDPVIATAAAAISRACGADTAFVRSGGSIPIVAGFAEKGIPTVVSGFGLPEDDIHAPNESYALRSLELGQAAAREIYMSLASLTR